MENQTQDNISTEQQLKAIAFPVILKWSFIMIFFRYVMIFAFVLSFFSFAIVSNDAARLICTITAGIGFLVMIFTHLCMTTLIIHAGRLINQIDRLTKD